VHGVSELSPLAQARRAKDRFVPSADGAEVTDTMTGLVWRRCAEGMTWDNDAQTCAGSGTRGFWWQDAMEYAKANRKSGWRIPNVKELLTIIDYGTRNGAYDHLAFPNMHYYDAYITSTPSVVSAGAAEREREFVQVVSFWYGNVYPGYTYVGHHLLMVRRSLE
jgi:hypothetical protein